MPTQRTDDLDDDYVPDNLVADDPDDPVSIESDSDEPDFTSYSVGAGPIAAPLAGSSSASTDDAAKAKKRKRREKEKEKKLKKRRLAESTATSSEQASIAAQSPSALADYLARMQAKSYSKLSAVELEDIRIPESAIVDTTAWTAPRSVDQLGNFIAKVVPTLKTRLAQKSKDNGAPTLLFIAGGALRVIDVIHVLKSKTIRGEKGGDVAKLFARHIKLEDHISYLRRTKVGSGVGTPGRIGKLLCDTDALSTSALTHIVIDVSFHDAKKRTMLDIPETRDETFRTVLGCEAVREGIRNGKIQLVLF